MRLDQVPLLQLIEYLQPLDPPHIGRVRLQQRGVRSVHIHGVAAQVELESKV